jgi:Resolvase, N terminal domain
MGKETEAGRRAASSRTNQNLPFRTMGGWALLADGFVMLLLVIGYTVTGGDASIFPVAGAVVSVLLLLGLPAMWALQPQTGRLGQAGLWCLGSGSGIALAVRMLSLVSLTEKIDTTTPGRKLIFPLMDALAEFEHDLIRERTTASLAAARA